MKTICNIIIILFTLPAIASPERLRELVKKDTMMKVSGAQGLNPSEKKELEAIQEKLGVIESAQITNEVMTSLQYGGSLIKPVKTLSAPVQPSNSTVSQIIQPVKKEGIKVIQAPKAQDPKAAATDLTAQTGTPNITININPNSGEAQVVDPNSPQAKAPPVKDVVPKAEGEKSSKVVIPKKLEDQMLKNYKDLINDVSQKEASDEEILSKSPKYIVNDDPYRPSPVGRGVANPSFKVERDSSSIITYQVNYTDAITIRNCVADGVSILFGDSIKTTISKHIAGDDKYFAINVIPGDRGVSARLLKPIGENDAWYSSVQIFRKDDGKAYLVNLVGLPCTKDVLRFPKVVYLEERANRTNRADDTLKLSDSEVLTPRDKIILESKGYRESNSLGLVVEDMVASAGADVVSMSVQADKVTSESEIEFKILDFHQVSLIKTTAKFLELHSKVHSERLGKNVLRWNATVSLKKDYMLRRRYIYLMMLNHKNKQYQYIQVDTAEKLLDLKKREYDL